jgi:hypothetical protein
VVKKIRKILAAIEPATQKIDVERGNIRKLSELEDRKQYHIKI